MTLQKKKRCRMCGELAKDHNRVKIAADGVEVFVCEACMDKERDAMLNDSAHPALAYYNAVAQALFGKTKTDD
jgi:ribosome-binding protein aMBF1 (putative translation factor)